MRVEEDKVRSRLGTVQGGGVTADDEAVAAADLHGTHNTNAVRAFGATPPCSLNIDWTVTCETARGSPLLNG